jgi:RHS repeat-associated protein
LAWRTSYDAYGRRRNHVWGQPPPASFSSKTTLGFTGHESDDEVGLVNMRGRVFDPKVGRFLTTDPLVSDLYFGQTLNSYSYVTGNPLTFVDPSGFQQTIGVVSEPGFPDAPLPDDHVVASPGLQLALYLNHQGPLLSEPDKPFEPDESVSEAAEFGAAAPPTDVDTTGSSPELDPQAATTAPEDWTKNSYLQLEGGFLAGVSLGLVPFGGVGQQLLDAGEVLPHGTPEARFGLAVGQIVGGIAIMAGGITGDVLGGAATVTGIGAAVGVPAIVVSTSLVVGGAGNVAAGVRGLTQAMMSKGPGSSGAKETGSYTNTHASGKTYSGKGSRERSQVSGRRVEKETGDQHVATEWNKAPSKTEAFKEEARRIEQMGGPRNPQNYNKIESPGKRLLEEGE